MMDEVYVSYCLEMGYMCVIKIWITSVIENSRNDALHSIQY